MENAAALWLVLILPLQIVSSKKVNIVLFSPKCRSVDDPSGVSTTLDLEFQQSIFLFPVFDKKGPIQQHHSQGRSSCHGHGSNRR